MSLRSIDISSPLSDLFIMARSMFLANSNLTCPLQQESLSARPFPPPLPLESGPLTMHTLRHTPRQPTRRPRNHRRAPPIRPLRMDVPIRRRRRAQPRNAPPLHLQDALKVPHPLSTHPLHTSDTQYSHFGDKPSNFPLLVPIMIGNTSPTTERALGKLLAPYLADPSTAFVISSDFAHWGTRFRYTFYRPSPGSEGQMLNASAKPRDRAIHESIKEVDFDCIDACESASHEQWLDVLEGQTDPFSSSCSASLCC